MSWNQLKNGHNNAGWNHGYNNKGEQNKQIKLTISVMLPSTINCIADNNQCLNWIMQSLSSIICLLCFRYSFQGYRIHMLHLLTWEAGHIASSQMKLSGEGVKRVRFQNMILPIKLSQCLIGSAHSLVWADKYYLWDVMLLKFSYLKGVVFHWD